MLPRRSLRSGKDSDSQSQRVCALDSSDCCSTVSVHLRPCGAVLSPRQTSRHDRPISRLFSSNFARSLRLCNLEDDRKQIGTVARRNPARSRESVWQRRGLLQNHIHLHPSLTGLTTSTLNAINCGIKIVPESFVRQPRGRVTTVTVHIFEAITLKCRCVQSADAWREEDCDTHSQNDNGCKVLRIKKGQEVGSILLLPR